MNLSGCIEYMKQKHEGQLRKQGTPYFMHPLEVSNILKTKGFDENYQIAGLFHDLLEDTDTTYEEILALTNEKIASVVKIVTKEKGYIMSEYIDRISKDEMAKMVKLADRIHNISEAYLADKDFIDKYVNETIEWYLDLAKGTIFENDLKESLTLLEKRINS